MLALDEYVIVFEFVKRFENDTEIDLDFIEELSTWEMKQILSEKMSIAKAIKAKKQKSKRMKTAAGKLAKKKLERKTSRSSYIPNKKRSRAQKKAHNRVRRNIPKVTG